LVWSRIVPCHDCPPPRQSSKQWSNPVYQAIENRSLWHLGFWEWIGSIGVFLFLLGAAVFLPENGRDETRT
jgi:hypothetical protein